MASLLLDSAQAELQCREFDLVFRLFDADGDGEISVAETERALANLVEGGSVSQAEALSKTGKPDELLRLLGQI